MFFTLINSYVFWSLVIDSSRLPITNATNTNTLLTPDVKVPVILTPQPVPIGKEVMIAMPVDSVPGVEFTCEWESSDGIITSSHGPCSIFYQAPKQPGHYVVKVDIVGKNFTIQRSAVIDVRELTEIPPDNASYGSLVVISTTTPTQQQAMPAAATLATLPMATHAPPPTPQPPIQMTNTPTLAAHA